MGPRRAGGGRAGGARAPAAAALVTLVEVPAEERAPVLRAYLLRGGRPPGSPKVAREARYYLGVGADPTLAEIGSVVRRYPVFRVVPAEREGDPFAPRAPEASHE